MAEQSNSDLVANPNLVTPAPAAPLADPDPASGDTIITAAEMFQQQLEQMTQWKTQLSTQMDAMRAESLKLMERQKSLALEKKRLADERAELTANCQDLQNRHAGLEAQSERLAQRALDLENAQARVSAQQADLAQREQALADQTRLTNDDLEARAAALLAHEGQLAGDRQTLTRQRQDLQRRLEAFERDQAGQLEALAGQSKRLADRRAEVDAAENDLAKALEQEVAQATQALQAQLAEAREGQNRVVQLEQQLRQADAASDALQAREAQFEKDLAAAGAQLAQLKEELGRASGTLQQVSQERSALADQLAQQVQSAKDEAARWQQALDEAKAQSAAGGPALDHSQHQYEMLRHDFKKLKAQAQELQSAKDELEFQLELRKEELPKQLAALRQELTQQFTARQAEIAQEKQPCETAPAAGPIVSDSPNPEAHQAPWHRQRLLRQARALRGFRRQIQDTQSALANGRAELAQQREQIRARRENLEQVKRLLEKQEMVMARKLADHNAIKTVAAVGIFVIMVLGSSFFGIYRFVHPVYRGEAVVQLAPPADLPGAELPAWLNRQKAFMWSGDLTSAAWNILRNGEERYVMHDVREEWLASLSSHLSLTLDPAGNSLAVRYTGPDAQGVSQVCNALAAAYTTPGKRDSAKSDESLGLGSQVLAPAIEPAYPVEDNRLMISLTVAASTLLVSLLLVMIFRHFIARQLREIDQMADAQELEDIKADLPEDAQPAAE